MAVFAATDRLLVRPLPFADPERLVVMREYRDGSRSLGVPAKFVAQVRQADAVDELTLVDWDLLTYRMRPGGDGRPLSFVRMAHTGLKTLGVRPLAGPDFTEEDARLQRRLILITYEAWQREFGGRPDAIGQRLWGSTPAAAPFEIVGILPRGFIAPQLAPGTAWSGIVLGWQILDGTAPTRSFPSPIARLRPGVSLAQAQAEVDALVTRMQADFPHKNGAPTIVRLEPLREALFGRYRTYAAAVLIAATLVLLVACANLASLLLVRARSRERLAAVRRALGASRRAIVGEAVAEALVLAGAGCVVALVVLAATQRALMAALPSSFSIYSGSVLEPRMLGVALVLTVVSAVAASVIPAWRLSNLDIVPVLQGRRQFGRGGRLIGAGSLLTIEVAVSTVLAIGALLTARTLANIRADDVGFQPEDLYTVSAFLPQQADRAVLLQQYLDMLAVIRAAPGVHAAAGADSLPMIGIVNRPMHGAAMGTQRCPATGGFMETLGMRIIAGRPLSSEDVDRRAAVGVLSLAGLRFVWPGVTPDDAVGRVLQFPGEPAREVVGVVSDLRQQYLAPTMPTLYVPVGTERFSSLLFAARVAPGAALNGRELAAMFESRGLFPRSVRVAPVSAAFESSVVNQRFRARLFAGLGAAAMALAMLGIYAVLTSTIASRQRELGIRISLGATRRDVLGLVLRDAARAVVPGIGLGLLAAWWGGTFLESMLYGIDARDASTFATVAVLVGAAACLAALVPARRATRVDPARALLRF